MKGRRTGRPMGGHRAESGPWSRGAGGLVLALGVSACETDEEPRGIVRIAQADGWARVADVADDVFGAERPPDLVCDEVLGLSVEAFGDGAAFEVDTDACDYLTARQPTLERIVAGDTVWIRVWHHELAAPMPAQGHVALAIDGVVQWETMVPIPSDPGLIEHDLVIDDDIPAGTELQFHVHNHGANTWDLLDVTAGPTDALQ